jgi:hypothetical protein
MSDYRGATEKVSQFIMPMKSVYESYVLLNKTVFLNSAESLKTINNIFIKFCSVYLFRAALYEHILSNIKMC